MLLSQMTVFAADPPDQELPNYTSGLYRKPYVPNTQDNELIGGSNNSVSYDAPNPIYYVVHKAELISQDNPNDPNDVQEEIPYQISLPDPLICARDIKNEPVYYENQFVFARISASAGDKALTISFKIESDDAELEQLHDIYLSISCDWDRDKAKEMDSDKDGSIDIATLPNDTTVVVEELKPAPPQKTTLTKSAASTSAGLTTWTVQCAVGNEDGKVPTELVDSLPKELDYVTDSAAVTVTP